MKYLISRAAWYVAGVMVCGVASVKDLCRFGSVTWILDYYQRTREHGKKRDNRWWELLIGTRRPS